MSPPDGDPVVPGRLYGLRTWQLTRVDGADRLKSLFTAELWAAGAEPTTARCRRAKPHEAPASRYGCGLYALHPTAEQCLASFDAACDAAERSSGPDFDVVGLIAAWGRVEVHADGFRAQHACLHALLLPLAAARGPYGRRLRSLAAGHGAGVLELESPCDLRRHCEAHRLGLERGTLDALLGPRLRREARPLWQRMLNSAGGLTRRLAGIVHKRPAR